MEIKKSAQPTKDAIRHFKVLENLKQPGLVIGSGAILCLAKSMLPLTAQVTIVPVGML